MVALIKKKEGDHSQELKLFEFKIDVLTLMN